MIQACRLRTQGKGLVGIGDEAVGRLWMGDKSDKGAGNVKVHVGSILLLVGRA